MTNYRKATYNADGSMDFEIRHPSLGWIPCTAVENDPDPACRAIFEAAKAAGKVKPHVPKVATKAELSDHARKISWETRTAGTVISGIPVRLDDGSLALINGMAALAARDAARTFAFDSAEGTVTLTSGQAIDFAAAVGDWVQLTFDRRALVLAAIADGSVTTTSQIDAAFAAVTDNWGA